MPFEVRQGLPCALPLFVAKVLKWLGDIGAANYRLVAWKTSERIDMKAIAMYMTRVAFEVRTI